MPTIVEITEETCRYEHRVALVPEATTGLTGFGLTVSVERGAEVLAPRADSILQVWMLDADFMRANSYLFQRLALADCTLLD